MSLDVLVDFILNVNTPQSSRRKVHTEGGFVLVFDLCWEAELAKKILHGWSLGDDAKRFTGLNSTKLEYNKQVLRDTYLILLNLISTFNYMQQAELL